jgi:hypothetical protein
MSFGTACRSALYVGGACLTLLIAACGDTVSETGADASVDGHKEAGPTKVTHDSGAHDAARSDAGSTKEAGGAKVDAGVADADTKDGAVKAEAGPRNYGDASSVYPAFTADVPTVQSQGGSTLRAPQIVTVTWPDEPNVTQFESFGDDIGASPYWTATTSEYGVSAAVSGPGNHVRLTEAPLNTWSDTALASWVVDHAKNYAMYGLPAPNSNSIYTFYLSSDTDLSVQGTDGCQQGIGGYHDSVVVAGSELTYAVILQCNGADLKLATSSASHELVEASTDPHPMTEMAYYGFDEAHLAWDVFQQFQDEVADACEFYYGPTGSDFLDAFAVVEPVTFDAGLEAGADAAFDAGLVPDAGTVSYEVQRSWSNASAAAGHNPCVPVVAGPYYAVTPLGTESISLDLAPIGGAPNAQTVGYRIAKGATSTFAVGYHSDAPTSGPWTLTASEGNPLLGGSATSHVTITLDHATGNNGDIGYVTVTVNAIDTSMNGELITIESRLGTGERTYVPILISNE